MGLTLEVLAAISCVLGVTALVWWLMARFLHPAPELSALVVLPGRGEGEHLEGAVRELVYLRSLGLLQESIVIADVDLTAQGYTLAQELVRRWPDVILWPAGDLSTYITHKK